LLHVECCCYKESEQINGCMRLMYQYGAVAAFYLLMKASVGYP
jgi:hypothetical protein